MSVDLDQARAAKRELAALLADDRRVNGIGIVRHQEGYGLKVNVVEPGARLGLPADVHGVAVELDFTGPAFPA